ncbi:hypothetical protein [Bradyrhizobium genosp. A]|uniref:hypothetical protein n=1 Tax=Bradyrhizobium genosp. A TaxID=83626 RepID=UPI003CEF6AA6
MNLEISVASPHGVPNDIDIHLLYDQIQKEVDSLPTKTTKNETVAKDNQLGDLSLVTWVVQHFDQIVNTSAMAVKIVQTINILVQALLPKQGKIGDKPAPNIPRVAFSLKTEKGEVRIERNLPLSDEDMVTLRTEIAAALDKAGAANKRS